MKEAVFWTNYFLNCERVRKEHFESRLISKPTTAFAETASQASSQNSLVPVDETSSQEAGSPGKDDESYIDVQGGIASAPCSLLSVEDLVLVNKSVSGKAEK